MTKKVPGDGSSKPLGVLDAIKKAAAENGVPLALALAIAQHESGFDANNQTGDNGNSWGLYQLNANGGEGQGMGNSRLDPYTNAKTALSVVGSVLKAHPDWSWGQVAAAAQRPADAAGYADTIDGIVKRARNDPNYFTSALAGVRLSPTDYTGAGTGSAPGSVQQVSNVSAPAAPLASSPASTGAVGVSPTGVGGSLLGQYQPNAPLSIKYYGAIAALAHNNPDLANLMKKYAKEDLSSSAVQLRLEGDIRNTKWYKTTNDAQRAAQTLQATNPTEYHRQFANTLLTISNLANQLGVHPPGLGLHTFAVNAYNNGWTPEEQKKYLLAEAQKDGAYQTSASTAGTAGQAGQTSQAPTGEIGTTMTQLQQEARAYLVPISDVTQQDWAQKIMTGQMNANDYTNYLKTMAKSLHPEAAQAIDSGITPETYYDPYKQLAAKTLEVPPDSVNFDDPKWQKALFQVDPKTGQRTSMGLAQWQQTLRSDPTYGYGKTQQAKSTAADFAENILNTFGAVGNYGGNG